MATEVIMPKVDMVMETGTFVEWLKKEGDHVNKGDPLFVITTDKANIELESPADGILAGVTAKPDDVIPVTEVIAYILAPGEALPAKAAPQPAVAAAAPSTAKVATAVEPAAAVAEAAEPGKVRATPVARRLAHDLGMDLDADRRAAGRAAGFTRPMCWPFRNRSRSIEHQSVPVARAVRQRSCAMPSFQHPPACPRRYRCRTPAGSRSCRWPGRARSSPSGWPTARSPLRTLTCL